MEALLAFSKLLSDLFVLELSNAAAAEGQSMDVLARMAHASHNERLRQALQEHLRETEAHLHMVTELLRSFGVPNPRVGSDGMAGLVREADQLLHHPLEAEVRDSAIIAAAQKVEHYEIASYGTLRAWAEWLNHSRAFAIIDGILRQEKNADDRLIRIAMAMTSRLNAASLNPAVVMSDDPPRSPSG
jgi:ferritin-like metal-binding protein YciE